MWQQSGLFQYFFSHLSHILQRAVEAEISEGFAGGSISKLRFFTQSEKRFLAAQFSAGLTKGDHFFRRHKSLIQMPWGLGEGAVVANISAQLGEGHKNLARIRDQIAVMTVPKLRGHFGE